jgi:hypothetical protein
MSTPLDLDKLMELADAATQGPRDVEHDPRLAEAYISIGGDVRAYLDGRRLLNEKADAAFIAACSPDAIRELVGRCKRLTEAMEFYANLDNYAPDGEPVGPADKPMHQRIRDFGARARTALHATPGEGT